MYDVTIQNPLATDEELWRESRLYVLQRKQPGANQNTKEAMYGTIPLILSRMWSIGMECWKEHLGRR